MFFLVVMFRSGVETGSVIGQQLVALDFGGSALTPLAERAVPAYRTLLAISRSVHFINVCFKASKSSISFLLGSVFCS